MLKMSDLFKGDKLNLGLDTGNPSVHSGINYNNIGTGLKGAMGFDVGHSPFAVGSLKGQYVPGSLGDLDGPKVTAGEFGMKTKPLEDESDFKKNLGNALLSTGKSIGQGRQQSATHLSTGAGNLGVGLSFEDLYGINEF